MAGTDILTKTENYGKAITAFNLALQNAASTRESAMIGLGADFTSTTGKVLSPKDAAQAMAPGGSGLDGTKMTTGFGDATLPTLTKEATATISQNVNDLVERGVGTGSGLSRQQNVVGGEMADIAKQQAVQEAQAKVAEANAEQVGAYGEERQAAADLATAQGKTLFDPKKNKGKSLNIWGGKVHDAKGKTVREASKKEIAAARAKKKGGK